MLNGRFEGWYYKQRTGDYMLAFIPGRADGGAFIQMIDSDGARHFPMSKMSVWRDTVHVGDCVFSPMGLRVRLPGVEGTLHFSTPTPLRSDIMGPFAGLPMQCRHGVVSMNHSVDGEITVDGVTHVFAQGSGYAEKDSGRSFPRSYLWLQCNDFDEPCSCMLSIAHIPFLGFSFTGCVCAVVFGGREYRLATYRGVRIVSGNREHLILRQGRLRLELTVIPRDGGHPLLAPMRGSMSETVRECCEAYLQLHLMQDGKTLLRTESNHAAFEERTDISR